MPKNTENFKVELKGFLEARGFDGLTFMDARGNSVSPEESDQIQFHYHNGNYDYGTVTITVLNNVVTVLFNQSVVNNSKSKVDPEFTNFLIDLKSYALRNGQMTFKTDNMDKLSDIMKTRDSEKKQEQLDEGYYGTRYTSYSDSTPATIKMIIKHSRALDETDQRFRHIEKIFLENEAGERLLLRTNKPSIGRAFARHLAEGGEYNDDRWKHINELAEDATKLGAFVRATKSGQFNESVQMVVEEATIKYHQLRENIRRIQNTRGYNQYFENWQPSLMEQDTTPDLSKLFTTSRLDPRIENALPVLNRMNIRVSEVAETTEFEAWADNIIDESIQPYTRVQSDELVELLGPNSEELPLGPDAINAIGELSDLIDDEELYDHLRRVAAADPDNDARPVIMSWIEEHSDQQEYADILDQLSSDDEEEPEEEPEMPEEEPEEEPEMPQEPAMPNPTQSASPPLAERREDDFISRLRRLSGMK